MIKKYPILLTFAYMLYNLAYGLIDIDWLGKNLTYSLWWGAHGLLLSSIFIVTSNEVFTIDYKISLRIIGVYIIIQSALSIIDIYSNVTETTYAVIILIYSAVSLTYWKYDRRRIKKS